MTTLKYQDLLNDYGEGTIYSLTSNDEIFDSLLKSAEPALGEPCLSELRVLLILPLCWMRSWEWRDMFGSRRWMGQCSEDLL